MKKLLVLGGTRISCEIIRKAKEMGMYVVVTDYNPPEQSPGKLIADESFMVSCTDVDAVVELIRREKIDGVTVGFADVLLPYYAEICRKAGLPSYGTKEQFDVFINKDRYKSLMREYDVPTVEEYTIDPDDFENSARDIRYPVLVKPADSSGARGITICQNVAQLREAYDKAHSFSRTGTVLVERYLTGPEVTVFWTFKDGDYVLSGVANRHMKQRQDDGVIPLPIGYTFPAFVTVSYMESIAEKCRAMFKAIGIRDGMMFMQCKVENGVCIVYDIGYRLTGSLEYKLFKRTCGYDPLEMLISFAVSGCMGEKDVPIPADPLFPGIWPFNVSILSAPGIIREIRGLDTVQQMSCVIDTVVSHPPGDEITPEMKGLLAQITVRVLGVVNRKEDLYPVMHRIEESIEIISETGENLRLPGIELADIESVL